MSITISAAGSAAGMHAVSGASWGAPPQQKMSNLFSLIDTSGSGQITRSQFQQAFQTKSPPAVFQNAGATSVFSALDPNGTGTVSKQDFVAGMSKLMVSLRADAAASPPAPVAPATSADASSGSKLSLSA